MTRLLSPVDLGHDIIADSQKPPTTEASHVAIAVAILVVDGFAEGDYLYVFHLIAFYWEQRTL